MEVRDMRIVDKADYINGKQFVGSIERTPMKPDMYQDFIDTLSKYESVENIFAVLENYTDFFKAAIDFANWFPKEHWKELFYAAKNGFYSADVPADCIYLICKAYANVDIPNLVFKQIPAHWFSSWIREGYLTGGYTLRDIVCTYCAKSYRPLDAVNIKIRYDNYTEIYIRSTDMVAVVPNKLGDLLSYDVIEQLECTPLGLHVGGKYIRTLGGFYGAVNSNYDLRRLV